ncbi:Alpha/Beta hydrolase protein [Coniella lustricola]|uniref:Alpha/Beta hydrolase protein n=1 Tax=Coniella lustricola TaxID=2025994 RepID=A0A2T2ZVK1_9PEZI|nr:Alpha/Beta hydrolase protein [Coniella lustricola]
MAPEAATTDTSDILLAPRLPLRRRVLYAVLAFVLQTFVIGPATTLRSWKQRRTPTDAVPTLIKTYAARPRLPVSIFFPTSYNQDDHSQAQRRLPLLLSIHGGGFFVGEPSNNDAFNYHFAQQNRALVVALNYAKSPRNAFPGPILDLQVLIDAVLADATLTAHFDPAKVAITGFSAGGNLALAVSQIPAIRERITAGVVPFYPPVDFTKSTAAKAATRRYKPALGGSRGAEKDGLAGMAGFFDWAYMPAGQDLRDPLLSPYFADRAALPRRIWVIGCELDMLGHEAWRAACRWAGKPVPAMDEPLGDAEPVGALVTEGDERFAFEVREGQGQGDKESVVKWLCVPDAGHAFESAAGMGGDEAAVQDGLVKRDVLITMLGKWLFG